MVLLLLFVSFALGISFLCSLLEAAFLSSRFARLAEQQAAGSRGAGLLLELKRTRVADAISAILILNTVSNTLGATLAGAQAASVFDSRWVGLFSGVMTFLILVVSEIIPKTLGTVYAAALSPFVGWMLRFLTKALAPALVLSRLLTGMLTRGEQAHVSRDEVAMMISAAALEGTLSRDEASLFANLLRLKDVRVEDVMTPRTVAFMMPAGATVRDLLAERDSKTFSRIPLYRAERDEVVGYVLHRDVLQAAATGCDLERALETFMRPISFMPELISVALALRQSLERREPMAIVTDEHGGVAGLVTLEDLTETVLGTEIVDESDRIVDLRKAALEQRDRRLERVRRRRDQATGTPAD